MREREREPIKTAFTINYDNGKEIAAGCLNFGWGRGGGGWAGKEVWWEKVVWKGCLEEVMFKPDQLGISVFSKPREWLT